MTINQAHNYTKLELDKTSSLTLPSFEEEEIDYWLDDAILRFAKQKYSGANVKGESFEQSQKRIDDLRTLIAEDSITTSTTGAYSNSKVFDLTALDPAYLFSLREDADITYKGINSRVKVTSTTHDRVNMKLNDPHSEHKINFNTASPLRLFVGNNIVLIGDSTYTINSINMSYIKVPTKMEDVLDRDEEYEDLTDQAMLEVVKMAANSMLENIESQRYQTHSLETSLSD